MILLREEKDYHDNMITIIVNDLLRMIRLSYLNEQVTINKSDLENNKRKCRAFFSMCYSQSPSLRVKLHSSCNKLSFTD